MRMFMKTLSFTRRIATRAGHDVRIYEVFSGKYLNGAFYDAEDDVWYPQQWNMDGSISLDKKDDLDLVNVK